VAGAMYTALVGHVTPEAFNLLELILHFAVVMVGGLASLGGSVLGALVLTTTPELFRSLPGVQELVLALLIIVILLFLPSGLVSLLARRLPLFRERYYRD
jgi:branched-chain amino acid transport system permease protein